MKDTGGGMYPMIVGVDSGHYTKFAYDFIDQYKSLNAFALKGKDVFKFTKLEKDARKFKKALERGKLYILEVNRYKDELYDVMTLRWDSGDGVQPNGFMNFPEPTGGMYTYPKFFTQFESEQRILEHDKDGIDMQVKWIKKTSVAQNHFWDVRIYNMALRDILAFVICHENGIRDGAWSDYVQFVQSKIAGQK
jgi:phage terminase large subunit GpA-like protein